MKAALKLVDTAPFPCQTDVYGLDWYVIHTNPRCEARATAGLKARGLEVYAPQEVVWKSIRRRKANAGKRVQVKRPAYPRYLFVGMKAMDWELIHRCDGVAGIVCMDNAPARVSATEIADLMAAEDMGCFNYAVEAQQVKVGDRVMLTHGWLDGYKATVKRVEGRSEEAKRITVEVDLLGKATPTVVPIDMIRLLA